MCTDSIVLMMFSREVIERVKTLKSAVAEQHEVLESFCEIINLAEDQCYLILSGKYEHSMQKHMSTEVIQLLQPFNDSPDGLDRYLGSFRFNLPGWQHVMWFAQKHGLNNLHQALATRVAA